MAPFEVVAFDACPMGAAVGRAIGCSVKARDVKRVGVSRIDSQVVDMLRLRKDDLPCLATVIGCEDAAVPISVFPFLSPCGEIESLRIAWVDLKTGGAGDACGEIHALPVIRLVRRTVKCSGAGR